MLKKRLIPVQLLLDGRLVKTTQFSSYRDVGDPVKSAKVYNDQYADELVFLNIARSERTIDPLLALLDAVSEVSFMPLAVGGGITEVEHAEALIRHGADKVVVNSALYRKPELITAIAESFGSQAVIASVDVRGDEQAGWECVSDCARQPEPVDLDEHLHVIEASGAGEVLINAVDRDGTMQGYDVELLRHVASQVTIPVIGCGGAGNYDHLKAGFLDGGVDALSMGSLFNFSDSNPIRAKAYLTNAGVPCKVV